MIIVIQFPYEKTDREGSPVQYRKDQNGNGLSVLGFGCMRFTRKGSALDIDKAER